MRRLKAACAAILFCVLSTASKAADYYFSDCGPGAHASCVAGADGNAGTPESPKRTLQHAGNLFRDAPAGTRFFFARGGVWNTDNFGSLWNTSATAANPITVDAYAPSWGGTTLPWMRNCHADYPGLHIHGSLTAAPGGYVFRNLRLDGCGSTGFATASTSTTLTQASATWATNQWNGCEVKVSHGDGTDQPVKKITSNTGTTLTVNTAWDPANGPLPSAGSAFVLSCATWGVSVDYPTADLVLDGVILENFLGGVYCYGDATYQSRRIKLINSTLRNNATQGVLWACNDSLIENNVFDNNGFRSAIFDHNIYLNPEYGASNIVVRRNTLTNNNVVGGKCQSTNIVGHGVINGLIIEGNKLIQAANTTTGGCWGIVIDGGYRYPDLPAESVTNLIIRANTLVNQQNTAIGCGSCVGALIENNVIVVQDNVEFRGIAVPALEGGRADVTGDGPDNGAIIRNNSVYIAAPAADTTAIDVSTRGGRSSGTQVQVSGNLIYIGNGTGSSPIHYCFNHNGKLLGDFSAISHNLCHHAGGSGSWSPTYATLATAKAAGFDASGHDVDPALNGIPSVANSWEMKIFYWSVAREASRPSGSPSKDRRPCGRTALRDIGAYEHYGASGCTPSATYGP